MNILTNPTASNIRDTIMLMNSFNAVNHSEKQDKATIISELVLFLGMIIRRNGNLNEEQQSKCDALIQKVSSLPSDCFVSEINADGLH